MTFAIVALCGIALFVIYKKYLANPVNGVESSGPRLSDQYYPTPTTIEIPLPPETPDRSMPSFSDDEKTYTVNHSKMLCSCPDFTKRRAGNPPNTLERACKHLRQVMILSGMYENGFVGEILRSEYPSQYYHVHDGLSVIFGYTLNKEWINVWAPVSRSRYGRIAYNRYGFSLVECRWSFGLIPDDSDAIEEVLLNLFPTGPMFEKAVGVKLSELKGRKAFHLTDEKHKQVVARFYDLCTEIVADNEIMTEEIDSLVMFMRKNAFYIERPPLNEVQHLLKKLTDDGRMSKSDKKQLLELLLTIGGGIQ